MEWSVYSDDVVGSWTLCVNSARRCRSQLSTCLDGATLSLRQLEREYRGDDDDGGDDDDTSTVCVRDITGRYMLA